MGVPINQYISALRQQAFQGQPAAASGAPSSPEQMGAYLSSSAGQALAPSDWNAARDQYQNAVNYRAAATPGPWQASYYAPGGPGGPGGPAAQASLAAMTSPDPSVIQRLSHYFDPNAQAGMGRYGDQLTIGGKTVTNSLSNDASSAGMPTDQYMQYLLQQQKAQQPAFNMGNAFQQAAADPMLRGMTGTQRNANITSAAGISPLDYQMNQLKQAQEQQALTSAHLANQGAYLNQADNMAKGFGADNMEQIFQTYGQNKDLPNAFYRPGSYEPDPINPGKFLQKPGQWLNADPQDVQALGNIRAAIGLQSQTSHGIETQRFRQMALDRAAALGQNFSTVGTPAGVPQPAPGNSAPMDTAMQAAAFRNSAGQTLGNGASNLAAWVSNVPIGIEHGLANVGNSLYGFFGGNGPNVFTPEPYITPNYVRSAVANRGASRPLIGSASR